MISHPIAYQANMATYSWRSVQAHDLPALYQLLLANAPTDQPETPPSLERIRHLFGVLGGHLERDTLAAIAPDDTLAAFGFVLFPPDEDEHFALFDGNVHIAYRGQGIGKHIVNWLETRARQEFHSLSDGVPQIFRTSCAARAWRIVHADRKTFTRKYHAPSGDCRTRRAPHRRLATLA